MIVLEHAPASPLRIELATSDEHILSVRPVVLAMPAGRRTALFHYSGDAAGEAQISAAGAPYSTTPASLEVVPNGIPGTLREAAVRRHLLMGSAASADEFGYPSPLRTEHAYANTLREQYNMLEPENALKWIAVHPEKDRYDFSAADQLVEFALQNSMEVRGHTLCWSETNPRWLDHYKTAKSGELSELLHQHIQTVMAHYRGKIFAWDVVNEAIDDETSGGQTKWRDSIWYDQPGIGLSGPAYIEQAFRWAHEADPGALLFYNENNIQQPGPKFDAMYGMLTGLLARGVPIAGVGIQAHIPASGLARPDGLERNLRRLTDLGLQVHLTEVDVPIAVDTAGNSSAADLDRQAKTYSQLLEICLRNARCTAFQTWGFSDKHSWVPIYMPGLGNALPFDSGYHPKPAFTAMLNKLIGGRIRSTSAH